MNYHIELQRNDITLAQFFAEVRYQLKKKARELGIEAWMLTGTLDDRDIFENPPRPEDSRYYVKDGKKICTYNGHRSEWPTKHAACASEILRTLPYDYQCYVRNFDGSCYNEILEFTFDDDKRGHGYYYTANKDATPA